MQAAEWMQTFDEVLTAANGFLHTRASTSFSAGSSVKSEAGRR